MIRTRARLNAALTVLSIGLLSCLPLQAEEATDDAAHLRHLKEVLWPQAYRENDTELLARILAEDFWMIDANGQWTGRSEELGSLPGYAWTHEHFEYRIRRLSIEDGRFAIIAGEGRARGEGQDGRYCLRYQSSNILVKRDGRWQATMSHVSGVDTSCADDS